MCAAKERSGQTRDLKGAKVTVTGYVNGEPRTQLELLEGFRKVPFGLGAPQDLAVKPASLQAKLLGAKFPHMQTLNSRSLCL